ncbi:conserved hypothetical protein, partial [Ricinus communis]
TTTCPTISDGSSEYEAERPTAPPTWSSTNQSPVDTAWPLIRVWVSDGAVPRIDTRSFSSKPPEPAPEVEMFTPGTRCSESATFLSGILPTSSAVMTSTLLDALRFTDSDCCSDPRIPLTMTVSGSLSDAACCAWAFIATLSVRMAAAVAMGVSLDILMLFELWYMFPPVDEGSAEPADC